MGGLPREELRTARLLLREPRTADVPDVLRAMTDPDIRRFLPCPPDYGQQDARSWVEQRAPAQWTAGGACFVVADQRTGRLVGSVSLPEVCARRASTEIVYWSAPWARGQGFASEAVGAVTGWALHHGVARLELLAAPDNPAGQRVGLAAGFRREGIMRGAGCRSDGTRYDAVLWARLASDPAGPTPRLLPDLPGGELSDGVVALHPLGPGDTDDAYAALSQPDIAEELVPPGTRDRRQVAELCARADSRWLAGATASLTIRDAPSDRYAGEISLMYTEPPTGSGMIGYHLAPGWRGRGFATRAVRLLADWALQHAGLARLEAGAHVLNTASQAVLERAGFRKVGRQLRRRNGSHGRVDDFLYELVPAH